MPRGLCFDRNHGHDSSHLQSAFTGMHKRDLQPELMDDPALDREQHLMALRGLARLNRLSPTATPFVRGINQLVDAHGERSGVVPRKLHVLDLATGSADLPIALYGARRRLRVSELHLAGADISPTALDAARLRADRHGVALETMQLDLITRPIPSGFDVITCSLFLHHLDDEQIVSLLSRASQAAALGIVFSDLVRSRVNLGLVAAASRLVSRSRIVHTDAVRSIRAALTRAELAGLADRAKLGGFALQSAGLCRMMLIWPRPSDADCA